jgi:hypothetical protein
MNPIIQELIIQCTDTVEIVNPDTGITHHREFFDQERFAQLIVTECLKLVEPDQTSGDEWCVTLDETAQSIRQHFGVAE